jgi:hypothetical protein
MTRPATSLTAELSPCKRRAARPRLAVRVIWAPRIGPRLSDGCDGGAPWRGQRARLARHRTHLLAILVGGAIGVWTLTGAVAATALPRSRETAAPGSAADACAHTFWRTLRNGDQRCPRTHSLLSDVYWTNLHWTQWTASKAVGHGSQVDADAICGGMPFRCRNETNPIRITLTRPKLCADGKRIYSRISIVEHATEGSVTSRASWSYRSGPGKSPHSAWGPRPSTSTEVGWQRERTSPVSLVLFAS